jgi:hypothetical protein
LEQIKLNKENPEIEFKLKSNDRVNFPVFQTI